MNDDALRRLLRNSLQGRRAPAGMAERVIARLASAPRRPLALSLAAAAAILAAAFLKLAFPRAEAPAPLPPGVAAAVEQHTQTLAVLTKGTPLAPHELLRKVAQESKFVIDLPGLREAGYEPREVHRCLEKGFAHVLYANSWSKLSCFLFEEGAIPVEGGAPLPGGNGRIFVQEDVVALVVKSDAHVKVWVSELKASQLAAIAMDAEHKAESLKTARLSGVKGQDARTVEAVLGGLPGVEFVMMVPAKSEALLIYDDRVASSDLIGALANMKGVADGVVADAGAEGR